MRDDDSMATSCIFCEIVRGNAPADFVTETETAVAFLDKSPLFKGHVLVVPKHHVHTVMEASASVVANLFHDVQRVSAATQEAMTCDGIFIAVNNAVSQSVAHLHVHVVPRNKRDGLRGFMWPRKRYESSDESAGIAERIGRFL